MYVYIYMCIYCSVCIYVYIYIHDLGQRAAHSLVLQDDIRQPDPLGGDAELVGDVPVQGRPGGPVPPQPVVTPLLHRGPLTGLPPGGGLSSLLLIDYVCAFCNYAGVGVVV